MSIYYGVVHDDRIELEGGVRLTEGTRVQVHTNFTANTDASDDVVKARLRAAGLLAPAPSVQDSEDDDAFEPVLVQGEPLSEQIIRERR
jgi:hypothetical protein